MVFFKGSFKRFIVLLVSIAFVSNSFSTVVPHYLAVPSGVNADIFSGALPGTESGRKTFEEINKLIENKNYIEVYEEAVNDLISRKEKLMGSENIGEDNIYAMFALINAGRSDLAVSIGMAIAGMINYTDNAHINIEQTGGWLQSKITTYAGDVISIDALTDFARSMILLKDLSNFSRLKTGYIEIKHKNIHTEMGQRFIVQGIIYYLISASEADQNAIHAYCAADLTGELIDADNGYSIGFGVQIINTLMERVNMLSAVNTQIPAKVVDIGKQIVNRGNYHGKSVKREITQICEVLLKEGFYEQAGELLSFYMWSKISDDLPVNAGSVLAIFNKIMPKGDPSSLQRFKDGMIEEIIYKKSDEESLRKVEIKYALPEEVPIAENKKELMERMNGLIEGKKYRDLYRLARDSVCNIVRDGYEPVLFAMYKLADAGRIAEASAIGIGIAEIFTEQELSGDYPRPNVERWIMWNVEHVVLADNIKRLITNLIQTNERLRTLHYYRGGIGNLQAYGEGEEIFIEFTLKQLIKQESRMITAADILIRHVETAEESKRINSSLERIVTEVLAASKDPKVIKEVVILTELISDPESSVFNYETVENICIALLKNGHDVEPAEILLSYYGLNGDDITSEEIEDEVNKMVEKAGKQKVKPETINRFSILFLSRLHNLIVALPDGTLVGVESLSTEQAFEALSQSL
ncbi:MAG: hypothetical protein ABII23_03090 [bacterium]